LRDFRKYTIWKEGIELVKEIYQLISSFPKEEKFGLVSQMCRASISIPSNIAEGCSRKSEKEFCRFLEISMGSSFELETQLLISVELGFLNLDSIQEILLKIERLQKQINQLILKIDKG
jgi:four helix bundle protein